MYKLILKNLVQFTFFCFFTLNTSGHVANDPDTYTPNIIPPSPTAYKLGTYGNTPIGLFTGSQNINVPLYTFKTANLEVPISMFYSSNGIKVDELSSNVGQSWNLSFGGVITRVVRDKPDEERGQYPVPISINETMGRLSPPALEFYQYIGENDVDSEADLFSFNFGKYSGKFVFDNEGGIVLMPAQEFQIQCIISPEGFDFVVTAPDGVKYYFSDKEITTQRVVGSGHSIPVITVSSWYLSKIVHPKGDEILFTYESTTSTYVSSQSQSFRMLSPRIQYDEAGNLEHYSQGLSLICDHTVSLNGKAIKSIKSLNPAYGEVLFTYVASSSADVTTGNKKIDQIIIKNKSAAEIEKINFSYTTTTNKRVFLDKIQFKDINQNYQFEYLNRDSFPQRLSRSQDHWGYYNGKTNTNLVPKNIKAYELESADYEGADKEIDGNFVARGLLKKITYPTKGYTTFDYEPNTYYGERKIYPNKVNVNVTAMVSDTATVRHDTRTTSFKIDTSQSVSLYSIVYIGCESQSADAAKATANLSVYDNTAKTYVSLQRSDNGYPVSEGSYSIDPNTNVNQRTLKFNAQAGHEYKLSITANWLCTYANLQCSYFPGSVTTIPANIITGGVRVMRTLDYSVNKIEPVIKRFHYARKNALQKSTGDKGQDPYYIDHYRVDRWLEPSGAGSFGVITSATYLSLSSSSITSLFDTGNSNIYYNYVTISYGNDDFLNGGEEHEFIVHRDGGDGYVIGNNYIRNTPLSNLGWDNGLVKRIDYFNKDLKTVKEVINEYEEKTAFKKTVISYSARKNFEKLASAPVNYVCTAADLTKTTPYRSCLTSHKHERAGSLINNLSGNVRYDDDCIASGNNNVTLYINHPCYNGTVGKIISNISNIDNLSIVTYNNNGFWHYLKSSTEITYDIKGTSPITVVNNYNYSSTKHLQLTSQTIKNSKAETVESKFYYPADLLSSTQSAVMQKLVNQNRVGEPVKTEKWVNNVQTSENATKYEESVATGNLLLPKEIHAIKAAGDIDLTTTTNRRIEFSVYDTNLVNGVSKGNGNILEYKQEGGIPVAIIWGYNKTLPIAKIENATYSQISSYVSNLQNLSDTGTEANLILALTAMRNALPNMMVTTYTYLPLIGISTSTDPKGAVTSYYYDNLNRLKQIKDNYGKIVSEYQYHYKN